MMARRTVLGLFVSGAAALLAGCGLLGGNSYRFKMTVEVETPQGLRTGSSVYEVSAENKVAITPGMVDRGWSVKGEAVAVDMPDGQTLFALLKTNAKHNDMVGLSMTALDPAFKNDIVESAARISSEDGIRSPAKVSPSDYPLLVTFRDIRDPKSIERVDPANLASSFGNGVVLKRITVEVTDEDVTTGIETRLGWLADLKGGYLHGGFSSRGAPLGLSGLDFSTELRR